MPTQQDFDALLNSPSFKRKLKAAQDHLEFMKTVKTKGLAAAAKKFNLCDSYASIKPYLMLVMPLLGLLDKKIAATIQQFITGADAGCAAVK